MCVITYKRLHFQRFIVAPTALDQLPSSYQSVRGRDADDVAHMLSFPATLCNSALRVPLPRTSQNCILPSVGDVCNSGRQYNEGHNSTTPGMSFDQGEKPFAGARMKKSIPGTAEYKAMHGDAGGLPG
jgi:hypothetical protein